MKNDDMETTGIATPDTAFPGITAATIHNARATMELLAPAGDRAAMVAAVQHGADAVYLGFTAFGARGYAGNFDENGLREAIAYCHERGRRVYVTVNTLVKQGEIPALHSVLALISDAQADAVIVQDLGVAMLARHCFPDLPVHASTQMTLHNAQGAIFARSLGITRVVPARECPLSELAAMARAGVEVEAFVHGALCVSVSGQCLFSGMVGGRSGNRGRCAQPCRLPYSCGQRQRCENYPLSMRDLMTIEHLPALAQAGIAALKIEGRMRRPEYVGVTVAAYRRALDALRSDAAYTLGEAQRDALLQAFHRGGFTRGHILGAAMTELIDPSRPGHGGLAMGVVESVRSGLAVLRPTRTLHDGDGLQVRSTSEGELTYAGPEVPPGGWAILRAPFALRPGDAIFRLTDAQAQQDIRDACTRENLREPVDAALTVMPGAPAHLTLRCGEHEGAAASDAPVAFAQRQPLDEASARRQLDRLGDAPYVLRALNLRTENAFLPVSTLNSLRRAALEALRAARLTRFPRRTLPLPAAGLARNRNLAKLAGTPALIAQTPHLAYMSRLFKAGAQAIYWAPDDYRLSALEVALSNVPTADAPDAPRPWLVLPPFTRGEELEALAAWLCGHAGRFAGAVLTNPGQCALKLAGLPLVADASLNVYNTFSADVLAGNGCARATLSPELNAREIAQTLAQGGAWEIAVYGRTQLMLLSHCPQRTLMGATACGACGRGDALPPLVDRKGYVFPLRRLVMPHGCHVRVLNSLPTWLPDKHARALHGLDAHASLSWRLCFQDETPEQCEMLLRHAGAIRSGDIVADLLPFATTSGHFARGVE